VLALCGAVFICSLVEYVVVLVFLMSRPLQRESNAWDVWYDIITAGMV
jgi:preprotein translocase subunit YajC